MTKEFDERHADKSRAVCAGMAEEHATEKRVLTERERQILDMWPRFEDGECVWFGDEVTLTDGVCEGLCQVHIGETGYSLYTDTHDEWHDSGKRVKRPGQSVLDADGVEIRVGDTVWDVQNGHEWTVVEIGKFGVFKIHLRLSSQANSHRGMFCNGSNLTHTRPDSWEQLEEDAAYNDEMGVANGQLDLVRRAKALAGVK